MSAEDSSLNHISALKWALLSLEQGSFQENVSGLVKASLVGKYDDTDCQVEYEGVGALARPGRVGGGLPCGAQLALTCGGSQSSHHTVTFCSLTLH